MKNIIIIFLVLTTYSCTKDKDSETKNSKFQTGIVTASAGLILRSEPRSSALKIDLIPQSTLVTVLNVNGPKETINNNESNWYQITYNNKTGWAFGNFITLGDHQKDIEITNKLIKEVGAASFKLIDTTPSPIDIDLDNVTLVSKSTDDYCTMPNDVTITIIFNDKKIKYISESTFEDDIKIEQNGIYVIQENSILISLDEGTKTIKKYTPKDSDIKTQKEQSKKIKLCYYKEFNGFFEERVYNKFVNKKIYHDKNEHYVCLFEDEVKKRVCKLCSPTYKSEFGDRYTIYGYYAVMK